MLRELCSWVSTNLSITLVDTVDFRNSTAVLGRVDFPRRKRATQRLALFDRGLSLYDFSRTPLSEGRPCTRTSDPVHYSGSPTQKDYDCQGLLKDGDAPLGREGAPVTARWREKLWVVLHRLWVSGELPPGVRGRERSHLESTRRHNRSLWSRLGYGMRSLTVAPRSPAT